MPDYLFGAGPLHQFLDSKLSEMSNEVMGWERDYLLNASEDDLCNYLVSKYALDPPKIRVADKVIADNRTMTFQQHSLWGDGRIFTVEGQLFVIAVPFEGEPILFRFQPSSCLMRGVSATVAGGELHFRYEVTDAESDRLESRINEDISAVHQNLGSVEKDVHAYNHRISSHVRQAVSERKRRHHTQLNVVEALNIPIRRRDGVSGTYVVPSVKRKPKVERPAVSSGPFRPEPTLAMEEYEHILGVAQNMSVMLERSPSTFACLTEEEIRDHFLVQLNGHYEGQATGETFNRNGKTDILIREKGRNVFIAECKFWSGPKAFSEIIDQLLGYTSWRDTKTAIFLFNRNKDTSKVLGQIPALVKTHANFKRETPGWLDETRFRCILHLNGDKNRELILTVCLFDVPSVV